MTGRTHGTMRVLAWVIVSACGSAAWAGSGGWVEFQDETSTRLIADSSVGTADPDEKEYAFADVDKDGDTDIVCVRKQEWTTAGRRRNVLFMNEGIKEGHAIDGVFVDRTEELIPQFMDLTNDRDVVLADVNGDTWLDIITATTLGEGLTKEFSHPRVYINQGESDGVWLGYVFDDVDRMPTFTCLPRFCAVDAGDVDEDGDVDLYFVDYEAGSPARGCDLDDRLLINDGTGYFSDDSTNRMTSEMRLSEFGTSTVIADMNVDGHLDIVKDTALNTPRRVAISYNDESNVGFFDEFSVVYNSAPYHVNVGELNNDGLPDLVITDDGSDRYLINNGNGGNGIPSFTSKTFSFQGGNDDGFGGDNYIVDLNNDGFNDVVICDVDVDISGCTRRLHIYRNLGDGTIPTIQEQGGDAPWTPNGVHDVAIFDFTGDGWKDMFIGTCSSTQIWVNVPPVGLVFSYPQGIPGFIDPNQDYEFSMSVAATGASPPQPGTGKFFLSIDGGEYVETALTETSPNNYNITLPPGDCASGYRWYVSAEVENGEVFTDPPGAPAAFYSTAVASGTEITLRDEIEGDVSAWEIQSFNLDSGEWEQVDPNGTIFQAQLAAPEDDATQAPEAVMAFVTENGVPGGAAGASDVDGGPTDLLSPVLDLAGTDAIVSYAHWFYCSEPGTSEEDFLFVEVSNDGGTTWSLVQTIATQDGGWVNSSFQVSQFVTPTGNVRVRFSSQDAAPGGSIAEAGIDNFQVEEFVCDVPITIVGSDPVNDAVDARQPSEPDGSAPAAGFASLTLTFDGDPSALTPADFVVTEDGGDGVPVNILSVTAVGGNDVLVTFDAGIEQVAWTTITHAASGSSVRLGHLPGDVDGDGTSAAQDLLALIDTLNGVGSLPLYSTDVERSGVTGPTDVLREVDLLNGAGVYDPYLGVSLP